MIQLIFNFANEVILIVIEGNSVRFGNTMYGAKTADISGLRLEYTGTIRQFPDLADDLNWREKAIERFKEHIAELTNEEEIANYIIFELKNKGFTPRLKQKGGFRPVKIK